MTNQYLMLLGEYKQSHAVTAVEAMALARFVEWLDAGRVSHEPTAPNIMDQIAARVTRDGQAFVKMELIDPYEGLVSEPPIEPAADQSANRACLHPAESMQMNRNFHLECDLCKEWWQTVTQWKTAVNRQVEPSERCKLCGERWVNGAHLCGGTQPISNR